MFLCINIINSIESNNLKHKIQLIRDLVYFQFLLVKNELFGMKYNTLFWEELLNFVPIILFFLF
jgi:hypothetical protein